MYQIRGESYWFVLIDFDMATMIEDAKGRNTYQASSKHRTGTLPFMAHELIGNAYNMAQHPETTRPIRHFLRHDFESLFYVCYWIVTALAPRNGTQDSGHDALMGFAKALERDGLLSLSTHKRTVCTTAFSITGLVLPEKASILRFWFDAWVRQLRKADTAQNDHAIDTQWVEEAAASNLFQSVDDADAIEPFDQETCGGLLTRDALKAVLTPRIPDLCWYTATHAKEFTFDHPPPSSDVAAPATGAGAAVPAQSNVNTSPAGAVDHAPSAGSATLPVTTAPQVVEKQPVKSTVSKKLDRFQRALRAVGTGMTLRPRDKLKKPKY